MVMDIIQILSHYNVRNNRFRIEGMLEPLERELRCMSLHESGCQQSLSWLRSPLSQTLAICICLRNVVCTFIKLSADKCSNERVCPVSSTFHHCQMEGSCRIWMASGAIGMWAWMFINTKHINSPCNVKTHFYPFLKKNQYL